MRSYSSLLRRVLLAVASMTLLWSMSAHAQIYVTNQGNNTVSEYDLSGNLLSPTPFISGLNNPQAVAVSSTNNLFVADTNDSTVNKYNSVTGTPSTYTGGSSTLNFTSPISLTLATNLYVGGNSMVTKFTQNGALGTFTTSGSGGGPSSSISNSNIISPSGLAVLSSNLYVADKSSNTITKYDTTTGGMLTFSTAGASIALNAATSPAGLAASGNFIYVASPIANTVTAYNAATGSKATASPLGSTGKLTLATGSKPTGLTIAGNFLYITDAGTNTIDKYDLTATTQTAGYTAGFITTGLSNPVSVDAIVPEPGTCMLLLLGGAATVVLARCQRRFIH